jgi:hypothetical protein
MDSISSTRNENVKYYFAERQQRQAEPEPTDRILL